MFLLLLFVCLIPSQDSPELSSDDLFEIYEENQEAIDEFALEFATEEHTFRQVINAWLEAQPVTYAGPIRDRIRERRNRDPDTGEIQEPEERKKRRRRFDPDKKGILERIKDRPRLFDGSLIKRIRNLALIALLVIAGIVGWKIYKG